MDAERYSGIPSRGMLFAWILAYFALQVVIRVLLSSTADLDEADQCVLSQKLKWGYGPQPPLYTWIQIGFFSCFGWSILALSLFKNLLLTSTYFLTYANARTITGRHLCGTAAALSLTLVPQVIWESQRDLTHSVLSATLAAATLYCFLNLHERKQTKWFIALGFAAGLGLLSKYNYVFWLMGLVCAAITLPEFRSTIRDKRLWLALGVAALFFSPNGIWILHHRDLAFFSTSKFALTESNGLARTVRIGTTKLLVAVISFAGPLLGVYLFVFRRRKEEKPLRFGNAFRLEECSPYVRLLVRALWFISGVLVVLILGFHATDLRERWLQPILICLPVLAIALVQERVNPTRTRMLIALAITIQLIVLAVMPGRILLVERLKRTEALTRPYRQLVAEMQPHLYGVSFIVTDTHLLAGNLRLELPEPTIVSPELTELFEPQPNSCMLAWEPVRDGLPPKTLMQWARQYAGKEVDWNQTRYVSARFKYHHSREMRLAWLKLQRP